MTDSTQSSEGAFRFAKPIKMVPVSLIIFSLGGLAAGGWAYYNGAPAGEVAGLMSLFVSFGVATGCGFLLLQQYRWGWF